MPEKPPEDRDSTPDEPMFFSANPPPVAPEETHYLSPNPEFDRPGSNRRGGFDGGSSFFISGISGVREGYENAARLLAMTGNAMHETDAERRVAAFKEALDLMEAVKDDPHAADVVATHGGLLLGSMAGALMARRQGAQAENRKDAIGYYRRAIQHFIDQKDDANVLKTKYNLADAYAAGIGSDDRSDGKLALSYLREVIAEASPTRDGLLVLAARLNFGGLAQRLDQDGGSLIEEALGCMQEAVATFSRADDLSLWSSAMNTLGGLYESRRSGDRRSNLQNAIKCFEQSLEGRSRDEFPYEWSATTNNLLVARRIYAHEFEGGRIDETHGNDLSHREQTIAEFTKRGRPLLAASAKLELAKAIIPTKAPEEDLKRAKNLIEEALETFRERGATSEMVQALSALHFVELRLNELPDAALHGWQALALSERLEDGGVELERVREISQQLHGLDARVAILFLSLGETALALDALEYGRARFLRSALRMREAASAHQTDIGKLRAKVIAFDREISRLDTVPRELMEAFITARDDLARLEQQLRLPPDPQVDANVFRRTWLVAERLMRIYSAIIVPIFDVEANRCAIAVLALKGEEMRASVILNKRDIAPMLTRWQTTNWDDPTARKATIDAVTAELWEVFGHPAAHGLHIREVPLGSRVAIVPQGNFGQLPLALARESESGVALCDLFELSFAPSITALDRAPSEPELPTLAAIINPTEDLPLAPIEALTSRTVFQPDERGTYLCGADSTKAAVLAALQSRTHWLFSAHGTFDDTDARQSGLSLSHGERLTLDDLLTLSDLQPPRLVILSACDTGVHAVEKAADEFVGLPIGFLQLGAGGVLATLWPVSDASTAVFVSAFMSFHIAQRYRPAQALSDAQRWMRGATVVQIRGFIGRLPAHQLPPETCEMLKAFDQMLAGMDPATCPFEHPYYWGGFVLYGA